MRMTGIKPVFLSRLRERKGPAAKGGGKVRVFFLLLASTAWKKKEDPHPNPLPHAGEGISNACKVVSLFPPAPA
jgi:hypothetical protein